MRMYLGIAALAAILALTGCDTRADAVVHPAPPGEIRLISDFSEAMVERGSHSNPVAAGAGETADSLQITRIRTLVSWVKFHQMETDSTSADQTFKSTPMILAAGADTANAVITQPFKPGRYDAVKLNIHKLSESDARMFKGDTAYRDFITAERPTMIVEGKVFKNGVGEKFTYSTDITAHLDLELRPPIWLKVDESGLILLRYDPYVIFKSGTTVLDPRDEANRPHFDKMAQNALRGLKR